MAPEEKDNDGPEDGLVSLLREHTDAEFELLADRIYKVLAGERERRLRAHGDTEAIEFVADLVAWCRREVPGTRGASYVLITYSRRLLREQQARNVFDLIRGHLDGAEQRLFDEIVAKGEQSPYWDTVKNTGSRYAKRFKQYLESREPEKRRRYDRWLLVLVPPIPLATVGASKAEAAAHAGEKARHGSAAWFKLLIGVLIAAVALLIWLLRKNDLREEATTSRERETAREEKADQSNPSAANPATGSNLGTEGAVSSRRSALSLQDHPYLNALALSQDVVFRRNPGAAADTRTTWRDVSAATEVPQEYAAWWQHVSELEHKAAELSRNGAFDQALVAYAAFASTKNDGAGWPNVTGGVDVDCYVHLALERRLGRDPTTECTSIVPNGPAVLGLVQYEYGRLYEDRGQLARAMSAYANVIWRSVVVPEEELGRRERHLSRSEWAHLGSISAAYEDSRTRLGRLGLELSKSGQAVVADGLVVWTDECAAGCKRVVIAAMLDPWLPIGCDPIDAVSTHPFGDAWRTVIEIDGAMQVRPALMVIEDGLGVAPRDSPPAPTRMRVALRLQLLGKPKAPKSCQDFTKATTVCAMPDGRLLRSCP